MILIIDCGSSKVPYIEQSVDEFDDYRTVSILELTDSDLSGIDGVVISGAPLLITKQDMKPYLNKIEWIKHTDIPVLGICFGHQLIGLSFGSFGSRMREDRDFQTIGIYEDSVLFQKLPEEFEMMEDHCEAISVPQHFKLIAGSDACVNEAMQHESLPLFGVQFHPEISGNHGRIIFDNFIRFCTERKSI